jgi:hypothetical protein
MKLHLGYVCTVQPYGISVVKELCKKSVYCVMEQAMYSLVYICTVLFTFVQSCLHLVLFQT